MEKFRCTTESRMDSLYETWTRYLTQNLILSWRPIYSTGSDILLMLGLGLISGPWYSTVHGFWTVLMQKYIIVLGSWMLLTSSPETGSLAYNTLKGLGYYTSSYPSYYIENVTGIILECSTLAAATSNYICYYCMGVLWFYWSKF